jgi:hypothetical protein
MAAPALPIGKQPSAHDAAPIAAPAQAPAIRPNQTGCRSIQFLVSGGAEPERGNFAWIPYRPRINRVADSSGMTVRDQGCAANIFHDVVVSCGRSWQHAGVPGDVFRPDAIEHVAVRCPKVVLLARIDREIEQLLLAGVI